MKIYGFIYKTTCLVNGKIYIGQTVRWRDKFYLGSGTAICKAIKRYGKQNFKRKILRLCYSQRELDIWEMVMIKKYNSTDKSIGYNILPGTANEFGSVNPASLPEVREKISKSHVGRFMSDETRRKISISLSGENSPMYGKHHSEDVKRKLSEKAKIRLSKKENNGMYGKRHSRQTCDKISNALRGKYTGEKNPNFGHKWTDEMKENLSKKKRGIKLSEETRNKMRVSQKRNYSIRGNPMSGKMWITNGIENKVMLKTDNIPENWYKGRTL